MHFSNEISALKEASSVHRLIKFKIFNSFLDTGNLLRVRGRLARLNLNFDHKYFVVLPVWCHITKLNLSS